VKWNEKKKASVTSPYIVYTHSSDWPFASTSLRVVAVHFP